MNQNKTTKYFKYAIGEIILVVIGILIALQINNWNEQHKLKLQEVTYYCKIQEDLKSDITNINKATKSLELRQIAAKRLLTNLLRIQDDKSIIMQDYLVALRSYAFVPNKAAIVDITSSGKLENLKNDNLKSAILNYYSEQEYGLKVIELNQASISGKIFEYNDYSSFGIQELPLYQNIFGEELQLLLKSSDWQKDPKNFLFNHLKNHMNMTIILCEREKQLLNDIKTKGEELIALINPYCNLND